MLNLLLKLLIVIGVYNVKSGVIELFIVDGVELIESVVEAVDC